MNIHKTEMGHMVDYKTFGSSENFAKAVTADIAKTVALTFAGGVAVSYGAPVYAVALLGGAKDAAGKATDGDLNITGSNVSGENVNLQAAKDINLQAADNTTVSDSVSSGKSAGVGVQLGAAGTGVYAETNKSKGNTNADASCHTNTTVTAQNNLKTVS